MFAAMVLGFVEVRSAKVKTPEPDKTSATAIVSPRARPRPSIAEEIIPALPNGRTAILITSQRVAPRAKAASSCSLGVWRKISRIKAAIIGKIIIARTMPTVIIVLPVAETGPLNILLMGTDTRTDQGGGFGSEVEYGGTGRSDTTILIHLSNDRKSAIAVSIPRDSVVNIPACTKEDGTTVAERTDLFNSAFASAGPACTVKTLETLTGVTVNHAVIVDFIGFSNVVDALGGIKVCLTEAIDEPVENGAGIQLPAGVQVVDGKNALGLMRARYSLADGSLPKDWFEDVTYISRDNKELTGYPTQKPKELISRFVLASTNEGDVVADYYLGSGTTAKACQELNRNFIGCDLNPKAIEITKGRLNGGR